LRLSLYLLALWRRRPARLRGPPVLQSGPLHAGRTLLQTAPLPRLSGGLLRRSRLRVLIRPRRLPRLLRATRTRLRPLPVGRARLVRRRGGLLTGAVLSWRSVLPLRTGLTRLVAAVVLPRIGAA
jgi:hypothetical protein